ncbi:MAG: pseudouridine synthase [Hyphomonadaceae bacterium]|nr:pseudouridine synthase [Hyphomonadaceae bacterium]
MAFTRRYDGEEPQRINKWLAQAGVCSRREAEALVAAGRVFIDGARVDDPGRKILPGQTLSLAPGAAPAAVAIVLNKPVGVVSAQPERGQIPAARLLTPAAFAGEGPAMDTARLSLAPLGRLDQESRGLLLLSDDGVLAKAVIGPASRLDKEYRVRVTGHVTARKLALLRHGLHLDGRALKPAEVRDGGEGRLQFVLTEGRNRQIRRMCAAVDLEVVDLQRVRIGPLKLGDLPEGRWRRLAPGERQAMIDAA